jgi:hypothetical protein
MLKASTLREPRDKYYTMQKTVYYLVHKDTNERLRYYSSLAGARIAQRSRNARLGFLQRIERIEINDNWEVEQCLIDGEIVTATYCIVEDTIEQNDLLDNNS